MNTYEEEAQDARQDLIDDGYPVTLLKKPITGGFDDRGNERPSSPGESHAGYGLTFQYKAYYIANEIVKAGDVRLLFVVDQLTDEYELFYEDLEKGSGEYYALVDGAEWRIISAEQLKPTTTQILVKAQLRR